MDPAKEVVVTLAVFRFVELMLVARTFPAVIPDEKAAAGMARDAAVLLAVTLVTARFGIVAELMLALLAVTRPLIHVLPAVIPDEKTAVDPAKEVAVTLVATRLGTMIETMTGTMIVTMIGTMIGTMIVNMIGNMIVL